MLETASIALATFFATIGPLDVAAVFAALTANYDPAQRRSCAVRGVLIATVVLILFALAGELLLKGFGISLAALRTAGGVLLLLIAIEMVFARSSGATSTTDEEEQEAATREDIAVFPVATPLIAGPGAMGAAILLMADVEGDVVGQAIVVASLLAMLLVTLVCLLLANQLSKLLGVTGLQVITRVIGVLLAALAVQFVFDGIAESGLV
ncbi:MAG TPA: MarC family protein [Woeseiaceae bacterium]|nr:MarC family protein [Woeseiaceae bacterium]